ncbi:MAG: hypothetical protein P8N76_19745 [Pirellulaceae bacterium]|nr:hypothetical protein [Pirellulaceae bacterium]
MRTHAFLIKILSLLILTASLSSLDAGQNFTDFGDDHLWSNPDNWSTGVVPDDSLTHPSEVDPKWHTDIQMVSDDTTLLIDSTVDANVFSLHVGAFGGDNRLEMTGGSLTVGNWALNVGRGGNRANHEGSFGHMIMSGGTINAPFVVVPEQFVGSDDDQVQKGEVSMSGGTINANWLRVGGKIGEGSMSLSGTAEINLSSHLDMNPDNTGKAAIDLSDEAIVNISGARNFNKYQAYIDEGWLTANGGSTSAILSETDNGLSISAGSAVAGDFDNDGACTVADIDILQTAIRLNDEQSPYDLDQNGTVDLQDLEYMIHEIKNTWLGDANLDGEFDSSDLVNVFQTGEYEDDIEFNSTWATGDWTADGEFSSADFVAAFSDGGYEMGVRTAVQAVPEPNSLVLFCTALLAACLKLNRMPRSSRS